MLTTLSLALLLGTSVHLFPPPAPIAQTDAPPAPPPADKEKTKTGLFKVLILLLVSLVFIVGGGYGVHKLREYLKEADIIK